MENKINDYSKCSLDMLSDIQCHYGEFKTVQIKQLIFHAKNGDKARFDITIGLLCDIDNEIRTISEMISYLTKKAKAEEIAMKGSKQTKIKSKKS